MAGIGVPAYFSQGGPLPATQGRARPPDAPSFPHGPRHGGSGGPALPGCDAFASHILTEQSKGPTSQFRPTPHKARRARRGTPRPTRSSLASPTGLGLRSSRRRAGTTCSRSPPRGEGGSRLPDQEQGAFGLRCHLAVVEEDNRGVLVLVAGPDPVRGPGDVGNAHLVHIARKEVLVTAVA